jgi:hypothetical protein
MNKTEWIMIRMPVLAKVICMSRSIRLGAGEVYLVGLGLLYGSMQLLC